MTEGWLPPVEGDPSTREAVAMYRAGLDHDEAVYPAQSCHWCSGTGIDPLLSNRVRVQLGRGWAFTKGEGETPFAPDVETRIVRLACFTYDQRAAQGVILCPLAEAIGHYDDLMALGWCADNARPKPEWCCRRCGGSGDASSEIAAERSSSDSNRKEAE